MAKFHIVGSPPKNHLPNSPAITSYIADRKSVESVHTYLKLLAFFKVEVGHDKLVHAQVHRQTCRIQNLVFEEESPGIGTVEERPCVDGGCHGVIESVRHSRRERGESVLEHQDEGLLQELLGSAARLSALHQIIKVR